MQIKNRDIVIEQCKKAGSLLNQPEFLGDDITSKTVALIKNFHSAAARTEFVSIPVLQKSCNDVFFLTSDDYKSLQIKSPQNWNALNELKIAAAQFNFA